MIDEELYQQAADELNSDRRKPELWERAQRLAGNDHDEARFLYTNLRVEELLSEREKNGPPATEQISGHSSDPLSLSPLESDDISDDSAELLSSTGLETTETPDTIGQPGLEDIDDDPLDQTISSPPGAYNTAADPDAELLSDYVSEGEKGLDDTYSGAAFGEDELAGELEIFNQENNEETNVEGVSIEDSLAGRSPLDQSHLDGSPLEQPARNQPAMDQSQLDGSFLNPPALDQSFLDESPVLDDANLTASFDAMVGSVNANDSLVQGVDIGTLDDRHSSVPPETDSLDSGSDLPVGELDMMLDDVDYKPDDKSNVENPLHWLEEEDTPRLAAMALNNNGREPIVIESDPLSNELSRQVNDLDLNDDFDKTAYITDEVDDDYSNEHLSPVIAEYSDESLLADGSDYGAVSATSGSLSMPSDLPHGSPDNDAGSNQTIHQRDFPLDLTHGRKGASYSIYRRNNNAQAVKNSVSWSALFLTLPYLVYRHLFGTALAYVLLWIVAIGGLILSSVAWVDAGAQVTPLVQACAIGFALLCFIGLIYLPFRYGNIWRGEKLEERGFDLVATTRAKNPGRAISRARRHAALD